MDSARSGTGRLRDIFAQAEACGGAVATVAKIIDLRPATEETFGGTGPLVRTLLDIEARDDRFRNAAGRFFHAAATPEATAQEFTEIHINQYRAGNRPSLPTLVAHHLDDLGIPKEGPQGRAALLVAARAEVRRRGEPAYHNRCHFGDVVAHMAMLMKAHNAGDTRALKLTPAEMGVGLIAAIAHDLDHPGGKNALPGQRAGEFDIYRLEKQSFFRALPLLVEAGMGAREIGEVKTLILSTSPDGPHTVVKKISAALNDNRVPDSALADPAGKYPALHPLLSNPRLAIRAAMLSDSDLAASAFEGLAANEVTSAALTEELRHPDRPYSVLSGPRAGQPEELRGRFARAAFGHYLVGEGPASVAGQRLLGENYKSMMAGVASELAALKGPQVRHG